jgi:hypothetical protein
MDGIDVETYRMTNHVLDRLASMGVEPDEYLTTVGRFRRGLGERLTGAGSTRARRVGADATRWPMT